jgi:hypothetical protein
MRSARVLMCTSIYGLCSSHLPITWIKFRLSLSLHLLKCCVVDWTNETGLCPHQSATVVLSSMGTLWINTNPIINTSRCTCRIRRFVHLFFSRTNVRSSISSHSGPLELHSQLLSYLITSKNFLVFVLHYLKCLDFLWGFLDQFLRFYAFTSYTFRALSECFCGFPHLLSDIFVIFLIHFVIFEVFVLSRVGIAQSI